MKDRVFYTLADCFFAGLAIVVGIGAWEEFKTPTCHVLIITGESLFLSMIAIACWEVWSD
jgi:hypothetical protein